MKRKLSKHSPSKQGRQPQKRATGGASPGGIVDDETVLKVKCPYTERTSP